MSARDFRPRAGHVLLALWIGLVGADRIDFAGGNGPFIVTPFLALTPLLVIGELVRRHRFGRPVMLTRSAMAYAAIGLALGGLAIASVYRSPEVSVSAARAILLVADLTGTFVVALLVADRDDLLRTMALGIMASLVLYALFDIKEALWFAGQGAELLRLGVSTARFDNLQNAGPLPRLGGATADGNRAAFVLLFYMVVLAKAPLRRGLRRGFMALAIVLFVVAFSRSATLAALTTLAMTAVSRRRALPRAWILAGAAVATAAVLFLFIHPDAFDRVGSVVDSPIANRLSTNEGSAQGHLRLIERGVEEATRSAPVALLGLGYGSSYLVLQDVFPANRYGNFHSLYVTMFAEAGVFALLLTLVLMAVPLIAGGPWRAMIAGAWAFNVFYQTTTEPVFWFLLALAWISLSAAPRIRASSSGP